MGLKTKGIDKHGAKATYVNIKGVGNVSFNLDQKQISLTILPNLYTSKTYREKEGSTPLNSNEQTDFEDVIIDGENFDHIMKVLYQALKEKDRYKTSEDC